MRKWQTCKDSGGGFKHNGYHRTRAEAIRVSNELKRQGFPAFYGKREACAKRMERLRRELKSSLYTLKD